MFSLVGTLLSAALPLLTVGKPLISYAALGDSYAAGGGAGSPKLFPHLDIGCGRFDGAYPIKVAHDLHLVFRNLACAGSVSASVLNSQIPSADDSDVVSVQVGGNEVGFFGLLNECVQQWKPLSTCQREIAKTRGLIQSTNFIDSYDRLVLGAQRQLKPDVILLILGYARFFNAETEQCNHVTFSRTDPQNFLTKAMRVMFNEIVSDLNNVIKSIAEAHGAIYVDVDKVFDGHRFCEAGVLEPAPDKSWFFNDPGTSLDPIHWQSDQQVFRDTSRLGGGFLNLTRTFHPKIDGHVAIADDIMRLLKNSH